MEERRQFVRLDTRLDLTYTEVTGAAKHQTVSKNIGGGGVCLFLEKELPVGTRLQVSIKIPGQEQPVNFLTEVIWCESYEVVGKTQRHRAIEAGVRIVEIAPTDHQVLLNHVILSLKAPQ